MLRRVRNLEEGIWRSVLLLLLLVDGVFLLLVGVVLLLVQVVICKDEWEKIVTDKMPLLMICSYINFNEQKKKKQQWNQNNFAPLILAKRTTLHSCILILTVYKKNKRFPSQKTQKRAHPSMLTLINIDKNVSFRDCKPHQASLMLE